MALIKAKVKFFYIFEVGMYANSKFSEKPVATTDVLNSNLYLE